MNFIPTWPVGVPRVYKPFASMNFKVDTYNLADVRALEHAAKTRAREEAKRCSQSYRYLKYPRASDFATLSSFTAEAALTSGNSQPWLEAGFFNFDQPTRMFRLWGDGVVSSTGTPTYTFSVRMSSTAASVAGTVIGVSAAITTASGITNQAWSFYLDVISTTTIGIGAGNLTLSSAGFVRSPGGFAAPYEYSLIPSQGALATWTATGDISVNNYINVSVACSANSSSNAITLKRLFLDVLN